MASLLFVNNCDGLSRKDEWQIFRNGTGADFLNDMKKAAPTREIRERFNDLIFDVHPYAEPWDTAAWHIVAVESRLNELEDDKKISILDLDSGRYISREEGFKLIMNECMAMQTPEKLPWQFLRDLYYTGFAAVEKSAFWSVLEFHIIQRNNQRSGGEHNVVYDTVYIRIDFSKRTWWDLLTNNFYKSPCTASWIKASVVVCEQLNEKIGSM